MKPRGAEITAADIAEWFEPHQLPPEKGAEFADVLNSFRHEQPVKKPKEPAEVEAARLLLRRYEEELGEHREFLARQPKDELSFGRMIAEHRIAELQKRIAAVPRLPRRRTTNTVAWSSVGLGLYFIAWNALAEAGCKPYRIDAAALRFVRSALAMLGYSLTQDAVDRQMRRARRRLAGVFGAQVYGCEAPP